MSEDSEDIVQAGDPRSQNPNWRLSRGALLLGALGLVAGLAAGYAAGDHHAASQRNTASSHPAAQRPPATASPPLSIIALSPALTQTTGACSAQIGHELQLGVQVTNQSGAAVTLGRVRAVLPLGGLKALSQQWAPCGTLAGSQADQAGLTAQGQFGGSLAPGASAWFTVTFKVLVRGCPGPLPVQFTVAYEAQGLSVTESLPGFPDLSHVPFTGCPAN